MFVYPLWTSECRRWTVSTMSMVRHVDTDYTVTGGAGSTPASSVIYDACKQNLRL